MTRGTKSPHLTGELGLVGAVLQLAVDENANLCEGLVEWSWWMNITPETFAEMYEQKQRERGRTVKHGCGPVCKGAAGGGHPWSWKPGGGRGRHHTEEAITKIRASALQRHAEYRARGCSEA